MKRLLLGMTLVIAATIAVGGKVFIQGAQADDLAECTAHDSRTAEGDLISLTMCERGKPLPKGFKDRFPEHRLPWVEEQESATEPLPPAEPAPHTTAQVVKGASFDCGNGITCHVEGGVPAFVALEVDWYRKEGIHAGYSYDACLQEFGCF